MTNLFENYNDRVNTVADKVVELADNKPVDKETILRFINHTAMDLAFTEYRMKNHPTSKAWPEFIKDVMVALRGKLKQARATSTSAAAKKVQQDQKLSKIAFMIQDTVSQVFPDGDPTDILIPKLRRLGIDVYDVRRWLNAATKKYLGVKTFNNYMANIYDDYAADDPTMMLQLGITDNPYNGKSFNFIDRLPYIIKSGNERGALHVISMLPENINKEKVVNILTQNKELIIRAILIRIKEIGKVDARIMIPINKIIQLGLNWPEFDSIKQSMTS